MACIKKSNQPPLSLVTFKIAKFTAKNTLEKPYITNKKTIDIDKIKYIVNDGASYTFYYLKGRPSRFWQFWLFEEHLKWIKDDRRDYEDILKEGHYKGAYLLGYDEIVNLLNTEFECINEKSLTDTGYLFVRKDKK